MHEDRIEPPCVISFDAWCPLSRLIHRKIFLRNWNDLQMHKSNRLRVKIFSCSIGLVGFLSFIRNIRSRVKSFDKACRWHLFIVRGLYEVHVFTSIPGWAARFSVCRGDFLNGLSQFHFTYPPSIISVSFCLYRFAAKTMWCARDRFDCRYV